MSRIFRLTAPLVALLATPVLVQGLTLSGSVREQASGAGVPGVAVRLTPPHGSGLPEVVASTNESGAYAMAGIASGRYLFEVSQGATVVYRETVVLESDTQKDVLVQRR